MSAAHDAEVTAQQFESQRGRLRAVAHRMLGSWADADDAVQEAWLRLSRQDPEAIDNLPGWLTTVVSRVCIDVLRSRAAHRELPLDDGEREWVVVDDARGPEDDAVLADSVGQALLLVLDTLGPAERLAFVLHDTFGVPFAQIAVILDRSEDAVKMLASRARRKVRGADRPQHAREGRAVVEAFLAAARDGDFEELLRLLDPDVVAHTETAGGVRSLRGAQEVAAAVQRGARANAATRAVLVDGEPGIVSWAPTGRLLGVMACTVVDGRIVGIRTVTDRRRLERMKLPAHPAPSA